jgi:hypothetical protein
VWQQKLVTFAPSRAAAIGNSSGREPGDRQTHTHRAPSGRHNRRDEDGCGSPRWGSDLCQAAFPALTRLSLPKSFHLPGSPSGTPDNSPAIDRWETNQTYDGVPTGRLKQSGVARAMKFQSSLRDWGLGVTSFPAMKLLGYFHVAPDGAVNDSFWVMTSAHAQGYCLTPLRG